MSKTIETINPYTGQKIKTYQVDSQAKVNQILAGSDDYFKVWRKSPFSERAEKFKKLSQLLKEHEQSLAALITAEMGKPITQSYAEIQKCAKLCDYYAENAESFLKKEVLEVPGLKKSYLCYEPLGVILAVMPWNYPFWQVFRFAIPTLMAGNTAVLKHASNVMGSALKVVELFRQAGFDSRAFSALVVGADRVEGLIKDPRIKAVSLTGSEAAGKAVARACGENLKKCVLELGGSDPYIVLEDAPLDKAVDICVQSRIQNSGQSCISAKRILVHESRYEVFKDKILEKLRQKKIGDPQKESTDLGPLARADLQRELAAQVEESIQQGAEVLLGGPEELNSLELQSSEGKIAGFKNAFYPLTLLERIPKNSPAYSEELFGPVFLLFSFKDLDEAVELANDTRFGLGGAIVSQNEELARQIAEQDIHSGGVAVNTFLSSNQKLPFGGVKASGFGRELSCLGIREFVNIKTIIVGV